MCCNVCYYRKDHKVVQLRNVWFKNLCNFQCARTNTRGHLYSSKRFDPRGEKKVWIYANMKLRGGNIFQSFFFIPFGVMGTVLEPIPAASRQRQGTPLNVSPSHCRALCEMVSVPCSMVPRRWSESVFLPPEHSHQQTELPIFYCPILVALASLSLWTSLPTPLWTNPL